MHLSSPVTEQAPEAVGKWEMIDVKFINSATHVALLPTNEIFTLGVSSLDPNEFKNSTLPWVDLLFPSFIPCNERRARLRGRWICKGGIIWQSIRQLVFR